MAPELLMESLVYLIHMRVLSLFHRLRKASLGRKLVTHYSLRGQPLPRLDQCGMHMRTTRDKMPRSSETERGCDCRKTLLESPYKLRLSLKR